MLYLFIYFVKVVITNYYYYYYFLLDFIIKYRVHYLGTLGKSIHSETKHPQLYEHKM